MRIPTTLGVMAMALSFGQTAIADHHGDHGKRPNVIVIMADDYGRDAASLYYPFSEAEEFNTNAPTLALGKLADKGILFTNAWAMPACTATRGGRSLGVNPSTSGIATALGRLTPRVGAAGTRYDGVEFPPYMINPHDPSQVQMMARNAGYRTYKLGKWHEATYNNDPVLGIQDVLDSGFEVFYGVLPGIPSTGYGGGADPTPNWTPENSLGLGETNEFMTSALVSMAIKLIKKSGDKPFYISLDFSAPHFPYEVAPGPGAPAPLENQHDWRTLHPVIHAEIIEQVKAAYGGEYPTAGTAVSPGPNFRPEARAAFKSLIAYMDVQIKRLMEHVDLKNTYVIFTGDNGTQGNVPLFPPWFGAVEPPWDENKSKTTLYRNGYEIPFIIAGPGIAKRGRESDVPVNTTDIYATVLDMMGIPQPHHTKDESFSLVNVLHGGEGYRKFNIAESFTPTAAVGGIVAVPGTYFAEEGRVVGTSRFRLQARAVIGDDNGFVCRPGSSQDPAADCYNEHTGRYEKDIVLQFYDLYSDPFENDALVIDEMSPYQYKAFQKLCDAINKVSYNAKFYQNAGDCKSDGSNLTDIDPI